MKCFPEFSPTVIPIKQNARFCSLPIDDDDAGREGGCVGGRLKGGGPLPLSKVESGGDALGI